MSQDFAAACQVYYDRVYRFLLALAGDPSQAEDLLPLYVDGCCTQSSRELVEEHLQECAACKQVFGEMTGDIPTPEEHQPEAEPVPAEPVPEEPEKKHEKTFRKGMKKIRRRWIASLIVVIILVPFVLLGIAQVTGDGLCYDNPEREAAYTAFVEQRAYESGLQVAPKE